MPRCLVVCQDCDSPEYEFGSEQDLHSWERLHYDQTEHERFFERIVPDPPPVKVNGRYRLSTANHPGNCVTCGRRYPSGVEIERLPAGGYAGPCCLTPAPSDTSWMESTQ